MLGFTVVVPPHFHRTAPWTQDWKLYKRCSEVECLCRWVEKLSPDLHTL